MTQQSLDLLRRRYVVEKKPLGASVERILRADTRAGARAILASIDKRRSENRSEGQRLRKMLRFETRYGKAAAMPWQAWTRPV
jgi:ribonuclease HII